MRGWYDITSLEFDSREEDAPGIKESANQVADLIEREISRGISANNILLAGFSQGGAIALYAGLTGKHLVGGILALSTYLPIHAEAQFLWPTVNMMMSSRSSMQKDQEMYCKSRILMSNGGPIPCRTV